MIQKAVDAKREYPQGAEHNVHNAYLLFQELFLQRSLPLDLRFLDITALKFKRFLFNSSTMVKVRFFAPLENSRRESEVRNMCSPLRIPPERGRKPREEPSLMPEKKIKWFQNLDTIDGRGYCIDPSPVGGG